MIWLEVRRTIWTSVLVLTLEGCFSSDEAADEQPAASMPPAENTQIPIPRSPSVLELCQEWVEARCDRLQECALSLQKLVPAKSAAYVAACEAQLGVDCQYVRRVNKNMEQCIEDIGSALCVLHLMSNGRQSIEFAIPLSCRGAIEVNQ